MAESDYRAKHQEFGDGIHSITYVHPDGEREDEKGYFDRTVEPDWESIYHNCDGESVEESSVSFSDLSAVFVLILEFILGGETLTLSGARAAALAVYLDPVHNSKFGSNLSEIAREANCSRAALSKSLLNFRDAIGVHLSAGKSHGSRSTYQEVQRRCIKAGVHSSTTRKDLRSKRASQS
jgi:hypothetical protein